MRRVLGTMASGRQLELEEPVKQAEEELATHLCAIPEVELIAKKVP